MSASQFTEHETDSSKPVPSSGRSNGDAASTESTETNERDSVRSAVAQARQSRRRLIMSLSVAMWIIVGLAVIYTCYLAAALLFPIVLAFTLNLVLSPLVRWCRRRLHMPEWAGATAIVILCVLPVSVGIVALLNPISNWLSDMPDVAREAEWKLRSIMGPIERINESSKKVDEMTNGGDGDDEIEVTIKKPSVSSVILSRTTNFLVGASITLTLLLFLLAGGDRMLEHMVESMPTWQDKRNLVSLVRDLQHSISHYLLTITVINVGLGCVIGTGLAIIGMPHPFLWGVAAAVLNYVPFLGLMVGTTGTFLVAIVTFDSGAYALLAPGIYLTANAIEANIITPALVGRSVRLNPAMVILFLAVWIFLWGIGGGLLAVPMLAMVKITADHIDVLKPFGRILEA